jgi:site-specific DNA-methyltransferase (adenine-specific)
MLCFGGTRTSHRLACAIEDAGFEIRDTLCWLYGSGFPKSHDVSKAIDKTAGAVPEAARWQGWGTALKPAHEPIIVVRKPLSGTVAANVLAHGTGAINIDASRVPGAVPSVPQPIFNSPTGRTYGFKTGEGRNGEMSIANARWPANVLHDGSDEVLAAFAAFGEKKTTWVSPDHANNRSGEFLGQLKHPGDQGFNDTGTATRFFYTAKANKADRTWSKHPTVKPLDLMYWLVKLVTPPHGTIIDPFAGSGTTLQAAVENGFHVIGCELEPEYIKDIERRMTTFCGWYSRVTAQTKLVRRPLTKLEGGYIK